MFRISNSIGELEMKKLKIKLKEGILHYGDAYLDIHEGEILEVPDNWHIKQLIQKGKIEIVKETKKQEKERTKT